MDIVCPSGLRGTVRKLRGSEANILSDRSIAKKGNTFELILSACWTETDDPGPYEGRGVSVGTSKIDWSRILTCDRFYALACIRIATYGSKFTFPTQCTSHNCRESFEWEIDLATDLPVVDLPDESRLAIRDGRNRFEVEVGGHSVAFKLQDGAGERRAGKRASANKDQLMTIALASRILEVDGLTRNHEITKWLKNADLDLQGELLKAFEESDGGIEQSIEIQCPECFSEFEVTLPFEGEAFWMPSTRKSKSKKRTTKRKTRTIATVEKDQEDQEEDR